MTKRPLHGSINCLIQVKQTKNCRFKGMLKQEYMQSFVLSLPGSRLQRKTRVNVCRCVTLQRLWRMRKCATERLLHSVALSSPVKTIVHAGSTFNATEAAEGDRPMERWGPLNSRFVQVSLSAGMITDKITLHINRKVSSTKDLRIEWKAVAEER